MTVRQCGYRDSAGCTIGAGQVIRPAVAQLPFLTPSAWPWLRPVEEPGTCMDARELRRWDAANERCPDFLHAVSPCRDCTAAYTAEMRLESRCHGRPGSDVFPAELLALRRVPLPPETGGWEAA
jgi:hypothetical protein